MPDRRLIFCLTAAHRRVHRWIDAQSPHAGVGAAGAGVLFHLATHDGALIGDVTRALRGTPSNVSTLIDRLARAGLLKRRDDPDDRRAVRLFLTPAGRRALADAQRVLGELNRLITDGFSAAELKVIGRWLAHVESV